MASAINAVVQLDRGPDGARRVACVAEVVAGEHGVDVRSLLEGRDGGWAVQLPSRPPRRPGVDPFVERA
jgi:hypothetical protein